MTEGIRGYVPSGLGYKTDTSYLLSASVQPWSYGRAGTNRYANVAPRLRAALEKDKALRVLVTSGYCNLATPFAGTNYTFAHGPSFAHDPGDHDLLRSRPHDLHPRALAAEAEEDIVKFGGRC